MLEAVVVIPCYNEEYRLREEEVLRLAHAPNVQVILVDDGSTDGTRALLGRLEQRAPGRVGVVAMPRYSGKSEAVRMGMQGALHEGARWVGYLDADFSTPAAEWLRLLGELQASGVQAVLGSRLKRAGAHIERRAVRHLMGRVFATVAAAVLRERFYGTQCGAKPSCSSTRPHFTRRCARPSIRAGASTWGCSGACSPLASRCPSRASSRCHSSTGRTSAAPTFPR
jgi:glycosyltransferase involved in cell wall biosynthesis